MKLFIIIFIFTFIPMGPSPLSHASPDKTKSEADRKELNRAFLPDVSELRKIFEARMEEIGNPVDLSLDHGILFYIALADRQPAFYEEVVAYFHTSNKSLILAKFTRYPYARLKRFSDWRFLALPEKDVVGVTREIGWMKFSNSPTKSAFVDFLKRASFSLNKRDEISPSLGTYAIAITGYQNIEAFETLGLGNFGDNFLPRRRD